MNRIVVILGIGLLIATYTYCTINQTPTKDIVIVWSDQNNPPVPGFEQHVDMYYSTDRDTIYMERSYGPTAE
jgi:hypothetical protein